MADRHPQAAWPGIDSMLSCTYTNSHGISPGRATLRILPQTLMTNYTMGNKGFSTVGNLIITDLIETVTVPRCRLAEINVDDDRGQDWELVIEDRRWKWRETGAVSGYYNQLDSFGKLIPWTIKSPTELAVECLKEMGETGWDIDLPIGLESTVGLLFFGLNPPWLGINPNITGTNPPISWEVKNPSQALQEICEKFGRRVIYQVISDKVLIAKLGYGAKLPDNGSIYKIAPQLSTPVSPYGVAIMGKPTRYQVRLYLEPVGEEFNGAMRPINELSYAPMRGAKVQISKAELDFVANGVTFEVSINGVEFITTATGASTASSVAIVLAGLINASASPFVAGKVTAAASGTAPAIITVTGTVAGISFAFATTTSGASGSNSYFTSTTTQSAQTGRADWSFSPPGTFEDVTPTVQLTRYQAMDLAKKHIWKTYRVADFNINGGLIFVPGYGTLVRRQQMVLDHTQCEQITPQPMDVNVSQGEGGRPQLPLVVNFYNGYSRDKPAAVFGTVSQLKSGFYGLHRGVTDGFLTPVGKQVFVSFEIEPVEQLVKFSTFVFKMFQSQATATSGNTMYKRADLILQTAVQIRHPKNNGFERFFITKKNPNAKEITPWVVKLHEDVQLNVIGQYGPYPGETPLGFTMLEDDPIHRAKYYLAGELAQFIAKGGLTFEYNGIRKLDLDGAISQVTWSITETGGGSTIASRNTEHSIYYSPYPVRRRREYLDPAAERILNSSSLPAGMLDYLFRPYRGRECTCNQDMKKTMSSRSAGCLSSTMTPRTPRPARPCRLYPLTRTVLRA